MTGLCPVQIRPNPCSTPQLRGLILAMLAWAYFDFRNIDTS